MTTPVPDHQRGDSDHNALRLAHLRVGMPTSDQVGPVDHERRLRELLGPFIAWLATRDFDESRRRRHRDAVERFLRWSDTDDGPAVDRRSRYDHHLQQHDPHHVADARTGLDRWTEHRQVLACTLPTGR